MPDDALDVAVAGSYAYVATGYSDEGSLQVIDISNPSSPQIVGSVDTRGSAYGVAVAGSYAYVSCVAGSWEGSLQVIDISDPTSPDIVGSVYTQGWAYGLAVAASYAYVAVADISYPYGGRLQVIDISDPTSPQIVGSVHTPGSARDVAVEGNHAYVADGYSGLQVIDISEPTSPRLLGGGATPGGSSSVAVAGNYAYVADGYSGLQILPAQCGLFIEATPDDAIVTPGGTLVQEIQVTNTTDSAGTVQAFFAARLPNNNILPLLGPVPRNGVEVPGDSTFQGTLNCPIPLNVPTPFIVGFMSYLLDYATGDTLDIDETWVEITEGEGMEVGIGEDSEARGLEHLDDAQAGLLPVGCKSR